VKKKISIFKGVFKKKLFFQKEQLNQRKIVLSIFRFLPTGKGQLWALIHDPKIGFLTLFNIFEVTKLDFRVFHFRYINMLINDI